MFLHLPPPSLLPFFLLMITINRLLDLLQTLTDPKHLPIQFNFIAGSLTQLLV